MKMAVKSSNVMARVEPEIKEQAKRDDSLPADEAFANLPRGL